ncbi:lytic transglycosylase domain-containing protein [Halalkalibacter alkalisediminis]|uniref:Lytic transglycosylase domain-containing protein n=1 Tax=Halalkalibacter alkalisediminis TaxID=935616 RepID=A0ABV6NDK3_9BACI|nr:lytic transglycosylase domain-containing protein [Halalkalibacter alkalisediminis]
MKKKFFIGTIIFIFLLILESQINLESNINNRGNMTIEDHSIPSCYIPIYKKAADEYSIPWKLLAAVHRVETIFSTMEPLVSHAGAIGHFQFMPRTWIGWQYPGTSLGEIEDDIDITDVNLIQEFGGYGMDASGNGIADPYNMIDAAFSAAKYLADHGASDNDLEAALFAYNHSQEYVEKVQHFHLLYEEGFAVLEFTTPCYE